MSKVLTVAWRDFKQTVMTKAFLFGIVGVPILLLGVIVIMVVLMVNQEQPPLVGTLAVVSSDAEIAEAVRDAFTPERMKQNVEETLEDIDETARAAEAVTGTSAEHMDEAGMTFSGMPIRGEVRVDVEAIDGSPDSFDDELKRRIDDGELIAAAIVPPSAITNWRPESSGRERPRFRLLVEESMDTDHVGLIENRVGEAIVEVRARRAGFDLEETSALMRRPDADTKRLLESGDVKSESVGVRAAKQMIPMILMFLLWGATFSTGNQLLMSTIEEKSNKVMEVLLSAVSPLQLMSGKIIGLGVVGLIIVAVYSSLGIAGLVVAARFDLIKPIQLVYFALYFFMAYFMVASMMAAVGSAVSDLREANSLLMPVMMLLIIPLMLWMPISQSPNGSLATAFSFIPPAIPFVMILRIGADEAVPLWQIILTLGWGYLCVIAMVWMASKVFRVGVLMYGKPPSPLELIRWVRRA
jgi:ABC-type Na+ efflux pump permease subunit